MSEIEACRTCGIFFLVSSNFLRHLHSHDSEMENVRKELQAWNVQLNEDERFPQYICTVCLLEFRKIFKFQNACLETQQQLRQLYDLQEKNIKSIQIKSEITDDVVVKQEPQTVPSYDSQDGEPNVCAFIYIDDLSDSEYDNEAEQSIPMPIFKVPHIPLKQEIIEEARVPDEFNDENHITENNTDVQEDEEMSMPALISELPTENEHEMENYEGTEPTEESESCQLPNDGIQCEHCLHVSMNQQEHRQHILRIHESKEFQCHICGKEFKAGTSQSRFKYHLKWHRLNKHIKCPQCGFHCASRNVLNEHTRAVHTKVPCHICEKRFTPKKLRVHMEKHKIEEKLCESPTPQCLECDLCRTEFTNQLELDQHILMTHSDSIIDENTNISGCVNQEELTQDSLMESETSSTSTASTHMSFSPDDNPDNTTIPLYFPANDESNNYDPNQETTLENAMSTVNSTTSTSILHEEMQFNCAKCPLSFPKVEQLIAHTEVHENKSLFSCNVCGKKFDLKFSLNRHMKRHKNVTF